MCKLFILFISCKSLLTKFWLSSCYLVLIVKICKKRNCFLWMSVRLNEFWVFFTLPSTEFCCERPWGWCWCECWSWSLGFSSCWRWQSGVKWQKNVRKRSHCLLLLMVGIEEWIAIFEISLSGYLKEQLR